METGEQKTYKFRLQKDIDSIVYSYQSYPYGQQYMSGFSYGPSSTATTTNYDRTSSTVAAPTSSMYNPYNSPGAFVPHSAINLSVKSGETSNNPHSSLDLTLTDTSIAVAAASTVANPRLLYTG